MNVTASIGIEIGVGVSEFLEATPEVQIYANANIIKYQWRDGRFKETSDVWQNENYDTRGEMKEALMKHLKSKADF
jgi:hypothetical protein